MIDTLLTTEDVAARSRIPIETLRYYRGVGKGPAHFKIGRRVVYREQDVAEWIDALRQSFGGGPDAA